MAINLHLQNLPRLATNLDIRRFFLGLDIPEGGVQIVGGPNGDVFVNFRTQDHLLKALLRDQHLLLGQPVKLFLANHEDMNKIFMNRSRELDRDMVRRCATGGNLQYGTNSNMAGNTTHPFHPAVHQIFGGKADHKHSSPERHYSLKRSQYDNNVQLESVPSLKKQKNKGPEFDPILPYPVHRSDTWYLKESAGISTANQVRNPLDSQYMSNTKDSYGEAPSGLKSVQNETPPWLRDQSAAVEQELESRSHYSDLQAQRQCSRSRDWRGGSKDRDQRHRYKDNDDDRHRERRGSAGRTHVEKVRYREQRHRGTDYVGSRETQERIHPKQKSDECIVIYNVAPTVTATDIRKFLEGWDIPMGGIILKTDVKHTNSLIAYVKYTQRKDGVDVKSEKYGAILHGQEVSIESFSVKGFEYLKGSDAEGGSTVTSLRTSHRPCSRSPPTVPELVPNEVPIEKMYPPLSGSPLGMTLSLPKPPPTSVSMRSPPHHQPLGDHSRSRGMDPLEGLHYLRLELKSDHFPACKVKSWFRDAPHLIRHVLLMLDRYADTAVAYVGFTDPGYRNSEKYERRREGAKRFTSSMVREEICREYDASKNTIYQSTESGRDRNISINEIRNSRLHIKERRLDKEPPQRTENVHHRRYEESKGRPASSDRRTTQSPGSVDRKSVERRYGERASVNRSESRSESRTRDARRIPHRSEERHRHSESKKTETVTRRTLADDISDISDSLSSDLSLELSDIESSSLDMSSSDVSLDLSLDEDEDENEADQRPQFPGVLVQATGFPLTTSEEGAAVYFRDFKVIANATRRSWDPDDGSLVLNLRFPTEADADAAIEGVDGKKFFDGKPARVFRASRNTYLT